MRSAGSVLENVEVVEMGSAIAGPFATKLLGDYGAQVTKIEQPDGDTYRWLPSIVPGADLPEGMTYGFLPINTSKDSVALDLKAEEGREVARALIAEADVLVENMRPGVMDRLGFSWEELQTINPDLVYCTVSGFGDSGPYVDWPAMDTTVQALGGWSDQIGTGEAPGWMNIYLLDHLTGVYAALASCMGIVRRELGDSRGTRIDVSMLDVALSMLSLHCAYAHEDTDGDVTAHYQGLSIPNGIFEVADGHVALFVGASEWETFCAATGMEEFAEDGHPFATRDGREEHRPELREALEERMDSRTADEWTEFVNEEVEGAMCAKVNTVEDLFDDPQIRHRESIQTRDHPDVGTYHMPRPPLRFSDGETAIEEAPTLGEDTDVVLRALGYSESDVEDLRERGVI